MQSTMNITLIFLFALLAARTGAGDFEPLIPFSNVTIARVQIIDSSLVDPYEASDPDGWHDSGFPDVDYEPGTYNSTFVVAEVLAGDEELEGHRLETGAYHTQQPRIRQRVLPIDPPFQPDEEVVIFIVDRGYGSPQRILGGGVRHLWSNRYGLARPQTDTYVEDLEKIERLAGILNASGEGQWEQLHDLALNDRAGFGTWAIDTVIAEYHAASPESENDRRADAIVRKIAASPPAHLTAPARYLLLSRLNDEETRDVWFTFMQSLATSDYDESQEMWDGGEITSALSQLEQFASIVTTMPEFYSDEEGQRILELYALALANPSVPIEKRLPFVHRIVDRDLESAVRFTDEHAFNTLVELLRQSDEAAIETAAAELIRDDIPLNADRRAALREAADEIDTAEARAIIRDLFEQLCEQ